MYAMSEGEHARREALFFKVPKGNSRSEHNI